MNLFPWFNKKEGQMFLKWLRNIYVLFLRFLKWSLVSWDIIFMPKFINQVSWQSYLEQLDEDDRLNVEMMCQRMQHFSKEYDLVFVLVAVGSVLNPHRRERKNLAPEGYSDIDLVLVPFLVMDLRNRYAHDCFVYFITQQLEQLYRQRGVHEEIIAKRLDPDVLNDIEGYEDSLYWSFPMQTGKMIQLFIKRPPFSLLTFEQFIKWENRRRRNDTFAYQIMM